MCEHLKANGGQRTEHSGNGFKVQRSAGDAQVVRHEDDARYDSEDDTTEDVYDLVCDFVHGLLRWGFVGQEKKQRHG